MTLQADQLLKDKDQLELAGFSIQVFHTPGHTPGGCCFYFPEEQVLSPGIPFSAAPWEERIFRGEVAPHW